MSNKKQRRAKPAACPAHHPPQGGVSLQGLASDVWDPHPINHPCLGGKEKGEQTQTKLRETLFTDSCDGENTSTSNLQASHIKQKKAFPFQEGVSRARSTFVGEEGSGD